MSVTTFYKRSDLLYTYQWTTGEDDPKLRGNPDHSLFSRREGWEVLYMINKYGDLHSKTTKADGNKIERMIHDHLPGDVRSQERVRDWILENWNKY